MDEIPIISATKGRSGPEGVEGILMDLFKRMNAIQVKWLVRIILKDMHIGIGQNTIFKVFHPDARELYDVNANLRKVVELLYDPNVRRNEIEISLFDPFRPMLAERGDADMHVVADKQMAGKEFYIEVKYDGERIQVHKDANDNYKYFSRNGNDFTDDFGNYPNSEVPGGGGGKFCSFIHEALNQNTTTKVYNLILDGEICAYNKLTETVTQKGEHMSIRGIKPDDPLYHQCLYVYDILMLNGKVLTNMPLCRRLEILHNNVITKEIKGRIHYSQRRLASTAAELAQALNEAIDRREEGLVVKDPDGVYRPNARGGLGGWLKIKPEYNNELSDHLDLIVLGGYYGGRTVKGNAGNSPVTHFLLGVANSNDGGNANSNDRFLSFCRVGSGYSNKDLFDLLQRLHPHFRPCLGNRPQDMIKAGTCLSGKEPTPDVWVDPKKSVILQVKAAEIVPSDIYKVGYSLRFPRVVTVRDDKSWRDCASLQEVINLKSKASGKLTAGHYDLTKNDENIAAKDEKIAVDTVPVGGKDTKTQKRNMIMTNGVIPLKRRMTAAEIPSNYKAATNTRNVVPITSALKGKVVVIEPSSHTRSKDLKSKLERIVLKHGGTVEQNVTAGRTYCYVEIAGTARAKSVKECGIYDVVCPEWLLACEKNFRHLRPSDMIYTTARTELNFRECELFDKYGDSYIEHATKQSIQFSMKIAATEVVAKRAELGPREKERCDVELRTDIANVEQEYFDYLCTWKYGIFRNVALYVDRYAIVGDASTSINEFHRLILPELSITFYGGQIVLADIVDGTGGGVTHVLVDPADQSRLDNIRDIRRSLPQGNKFRIVMHGWVDACVMSKRLVAETEYEL